MPSRHRLIHQVVSFTCFLAVLLGMPFSALGAAAKVRLELEPGSEVAPRGGVLPLDIFALVEAGWHINAHEPRDSYLIPTELRLNLPPDITHEPIHYPPPERKAFRFTQGKQLLVYGGKLGFATALQVPAEFSGSGVRVEAALRYQACNDTVCLPPATVTAAVLIPVTAEVMAGVAEPPPPVSPVKTSVEEWLDESGLVFTLLAVALLGVGLNLTPCVYPLISVTVAYFGGQGERQMRRTVLLGVVYVLGIAFSFSVLGTLAAVSGGLFGSALQKPAVILFIAGVLVILSLSSFGLYQLRPPAVVMQWAGGATSGIAGAAFMGLTMGIVAAPCIGPLVLALLLAVGARQEPVLGFSLFFALGCGMGLPYLVLAVAAGSMRSLPRSGEWLVWIERLLGFVLLGMAGYFVAPLLPHPARDWLLPAIIAVAGAYLGFVERSGRASAVFRSMKRVAGVAAIVLALWVGWPQEAESAIQWRGLATADFEQAQAAGRPLVIEFGAAWCIPCVEMARTTFVNGTVVRKASGFEMIKVDITKETEDNKRLLDRFEVRGVPTILVFDASGTEVERLIGYTSADELLAAMQKAS